MVSYGILVTLMAVAASLTCFKAEAHGGGGGRGLDTGGGSLASEHHRDYSKMDQEVPKNNRIVIEGKIFSPEETVLLWSGFVDQVQNGYKHSLFEYQNDLKIRIAIQEHGLVNSTVRKDDERFRQLLVHREKVVWQIDTPEINWLGNGYPAKTTPEFQRDVANSLNAGL